MSKPGLVRGTRDFGPSVMVKRNFIFDTIKHTFQKFGFQPLETPSLENLNVLMGKYGDEGDQLLFKVLNSGDFSKDLSQKDLDEGAKKLTHKISEKGLRYDLTVPFARYVVMNRNELAMPFKRYQIQPVWRADRPQKGRYREFYQCDADVVGTDSLICEAEIVLMLHEIFQNLGIADFTVKINNRKILSGIAETIGMKGSEVPLTVAIDKLDKIGKEKVEEELRERGFTEEVIEKLQPIFTLQNSKITYQDIRERLLERFDNDYDIYEHIRKDLENFKGKSEIELYDLIGISDIKFKSDNIDNGLGSEEDYRRCLKTFEKDYFIYHKALNYLEEFGTSLEFKIDIIERLKEKLINNGFSNENVEKLEVIFDLERGVQDILRDLKIWLINSETGLKGIAEIEKVWSLVDNFGLENPKIQLDITLARGLSYYTGAIFEVKANGIQMGSISGGGRYDNLTGTFGLPGVSGVGISLGVDRIYDVMEELGLFGDNQGVTTQVLLTNFDAEAEAYSLPLLKKLRDAGINAEIYPDHAKLRKQFEYADRKKIPYVCVIGSEEMSTGELTLKNMQSGEQTKHSLESIIQNLK